MTVPGVELAVLDLDFGLQSSELGYFVLVAETAAIETTHKNSKDIGQLAMLKGSSLRTLISMYTRTIKNGGQ